jgi:indolepyruvate ferredoxin oxidoreductase beta subunit
MKDINFVLGGLGGQGILFLTKAVAHAALKKGYNLMGAETHGMAQRGGSVVSHLRLGDSQSSLVMSGKAQFLLALEENEAYRNLPFLCKGGRLYVNARDSRFPLEEVHAYLNQQQIVCRFTQAEKIAMNLGAPMSTNLALLGFFAAFKEGPLTGDELRKTVEEISPDGFRPLNLKVFDAGFQRGLEQC